jgi:thiol-disulfide isomerase/thioredoxin
MKTNLKKIKIISLATLVCMIIFLPNLKSYAQAEVKGMHFEHGLSWQQVLEKAKKENKFIFIDCYTTWCGPCKMMSAQVFPLEEVGQFYNEKFINIKVQLDTTKNDNDEVKSWFAAGKELVDKYNINAYPTYLFFDADGQVVHRAVGSSDAITFIKKGKDATSPETQYYTAKRLYQSGKKDEALLFKVSRLSTEAYDRPFSEQVSKEYLATQKNLLTEDNIKLLSTTIQKSSDAGFTELLNNTALFDKYNYPGYSTEAIHNIIAMEEIFPAVAPGGKKPEGNTNWGAILKKVEKKYPAYAKETVSFYKIVMARNTNNWPAFSTAVTDYLKLYSKNTSADILNDYAWSIFEKCDDIACINKALNWSKQSLAANKTQHMFIDTYANLLYKSGKNKQAIEWETKARDLATGDEAKGYQATIDKMAKGEKTW